MVNPTVAREASSQPGAGYGTKALVGEQRELSLSFYLIFF